MNQFDIGVQLPNNTQVVARATGDSAVVLALLGGLVIGAGTVACIVAANTPKALPPRKGKKRSARLPR